MITKPSQAQPKPPPGVSKEASTLWYALVAEYAISDPAGLAVLGQAVEAHGRIRSAQKAIKRDGVTIQDRWGQTKPHPCLSAERDARSSFLAALRALNLDLEPLRDRPTRR